MWKPVVVVYIRTALSENKVSLKKKQKIDNLRGSHQPKINKYIRGLVSSHKKVRTAQHSYIYITVVIKNQILGYSMKQQFSIFLKQSNNNLENTVQKVQKSDTKTWPAPHPPPPFQNPSRNVAKK
jgi:hypothetical protein